MIVFAPAALARIRPVIDTPPVPDHMVNILSICDKTVGGLTKEENRLARLQRVVSKQRIPRRGTSADNGRQLRKAKLRLGRDLDNDRARENSVLPQGAIHPTSLTASPTHDRSIERLEIKGGDDLVALLEAIHLAADTDDLACKIGAGDYILLDAEGVLSRGDGKVTVVERYALYFDEHLLGTGLGNLFFALLDLLGGLVGSTGETVDGLSRHCWCVCVCK
jgi:hypothetical protein